MKEKTRWCGSYSRINEIHHHQKLVTLGKIFLCFFNHCAEYTLDMPAPAWSEEHFPAWEHVLPALGQSPRQPQQLRNVRACPERSISVLIVLSF